MENTKPTIRQCKYCGCSDRYACKEGCHRVYDNLCSKCDEIQKQFLEYATKQINVNGIHTSGDLKKTVELCLEEYKEHLGIIKDTSIDLISHTRQLFPKVHQNHIRYPIIQAFEKFCFKF